jgi:hypothetical protein
LVRRASRGIETRAGHHEARRRLKSKKGKNEKNKKQKKEKKKKKKKGKKEKEKKNDARGFRCTSARTLIRMR